MIDYSKYNYSDEEGYTLKKEYQNQKTKTKKEMQKAIIDDILKSLKFKKEN